MGNVPHIEVIHQRLGVPRCQPQVPGSAITPGVWLSCGFRVLVRVGLAEWGMFPTCRSATRAWGFGLVSRKFPGTLVGCCDWIAVGDWGRVALALAFRAGLALGLGVRIGVELDERRAAGEARGLVVSVRVVAADT